MLPNYIINKYCLSHKCRINFVCRIQCRINFSPPTKRSKLKIVTASKVDFILILSTDVLIDLLRFGRRRQLAALESIGRRLYVLIDVGLSSAPFIYFKYLCSQIEIPAWHFNKLDEQNKLQGVEDETVQFLL